MNAADRLRKMLDYERWANQRTLDSIKSAENGLLSQASRVGAAPDDMYAKHARALATMGHILWARRRWLWRLGECEPAPEVMPVKEWPVARLAQEAEELDRAWAKFLGGLKAADLDGEVKYRGGDGADYCDSIAQIADHILNHSTYHRGQVAMLVKHCGGDPAETDYIHFVHEAAVKK